MKIATYNAKGQKAEEMEVSDAIFGQKPNPTLVHQVYLALEANARQAWAHVKDRSEVRGGGRKPWKQKGTGRARHGSTRSPIWTGGGVTFGPRKVRNYVQKINKKMGRKAVTMCLSDKVREDKFLVLNELISSGKTKEMAALREALPGNGKTTLILMAQPDEKMFLATRNIPNVHVTRAQDVNVVDLLHHQFVITTKDGVELLEKRLNA